jgi:hypothetical protein
MINRTQSAVSVFALAASIFGITASASAQCRPDDLFCAELRIGPSQQPPPPVIVTPPPPPVIVAPPPPPPPPPIVVTPPPRPPVVIVQPPPPPPRQVVIVQPPPPRQQVVQVQLQRQRIVRRQLVPDSDFGLHFAGTAVLTEADGYGGVLGGFRLRPIPHIGIDLTVGAYRGSTRWEFPLVADVLIFFNPQHRFQVYALAGVGASYALQELGFGRSRTRELGYVGGEVGLGFEWRISRLFALNFDVRGFVRHHIDDGTGPEFTRVNPDGTVQSTDASGGVYGTLGMTFYLGGD